MGCHRFSGERFDFNPAWVKLYPWPNMGSIKGSCYLENACSQTRLIPMFYILIYIVQVIWESILCEVAALKNSPPYWLESCWKVKINFLWIRIWQHRMSKLVRLRVVNRKGSKTETATDIFRISACVCDQMFEFYQWIWKQIYAAEFGSKSDFQSLNIL